MTAKEALTQIKALFAENNEPEAPSTPPVEQFKEYTLADGAKVMIDKLEIGGKVTVMGPDGNPIPAPVGDHILADGQVITLDEAGIITQLATPEVEVEVETAKVDEDKEEMKKKIAEMEAKIEEMGKGYKEKMNAQFAEISEMVKKSEDKMVALKNVLEEFFNAPSADPIAPEKFHSSKDEKIARFLERAKNL